MISYAAIMLEQHVLHNRTRICMTTMEFAGGYKMLPQLWELLDDPELAVICCSVMQQQALAEARNQQPSQLSEPSAGSSVYKFRYLAADLTAPMANKCELHATW